MSLQQRYYPLPILVVATILLYVIYTNSTHVMPTITFYRDKGADMDRDSSHKSFLTSYNGSAEISIIYTANGTENSPRNRTEILSTIHPTVTLRPGQVLTRTIYKGGHVLSYPNICPSLGSTLKLLILIMSAPINYAARNAIRMTWGHFSLRKDVTIAFVVGTTLKKEVQTSIESEAEVYEDIIQGTFLDSYENLTLKTLSMFEWADRHCSKARFLLKTDDDMFINIPHLLQFMDANRNVSRSIFGRLAKNWPPIRKSSNKYFLPPEQYPGATLPDFTTGPAYLATMDTIRDLYENSLNHVFIRLEDVFITGVVADELNISRLNLAGFHNTRISFTVCNVKRSITSHGVTPEEQAYIWAMLLDTKTVCRNKR